MKSYPVENANPGETVIAMWHPKHARYTFCTPDEFSQIEKKLVALDPTRKSNRVLQRLVLGTAQEAVVDENGRVSLFELANDDQMQSTTVEDTSIE